MKKELSMKKVLSIILASLLFLSLVSCNDKKEIMKTRRTKKQLIETQPTQPKETTTVKETEQGTDFRIDVPNEIQVNVTPATERSGKSQAYKPKASVTNNSRYELIEYLLYLKPNVENQFNLKVFKPSNLKPGETSEESTLFATVPIGEGVLRPFYFEYTIEVDGEIVKYRYNYYNDTYNDLTLDDYWGY
ncbi:MAG TPA: hypothetical protein GXZ43_02215 [Clostridiaceae bacterium]|nr:hypothetical protein [Clostridiaceae bacterium]